MSAQRQQDDSVGLREIREILQLIQQSSYDEVKIEVDGALLHVVKSELGSQDTILRHTATPKIRPLAQPHEESGIYGAAGEIAPSLEELVDVRASMPGTFYRAAAPGAPPYVEVGARVSLDTTIGLVEVMKLFNPVLAGVTGTVDAILVEDAAPVDEGQRLVTIRVGD